MARKKHEEPNTGEWLNTYADMVTLLLTFFIMLFTMSSVDSEKWDILMKAFENKGDETSQIVLIAAQDGDELASNSSGSSLTDGVTVPSQSALPEDINQLYEYIKQYVSENDLENSVEVSKKNDNVFIRLKDTIFFDPDSAVLKPSSSEILEFLGDCFKSAEDQISLININGHTARVVENYSISVDRTLSSNRANNVLVYFEDIKDIDPQKLVSIGYGNHFPVASNDTPEGRSKNRRVDLVIMGLDSEYVGMNDLQSLLDGAFEGGPISVSEPPIPTPSPEDVTTSD